MLHPYILHASVTFISCSSISNRAPEVCKSEHCWFTVCWLNTIDWTLLILLLHGLFQIKMYEKLMAFTIYINLCECHYQFLWHEDMMTMGSLGKTMNVYSLLKKKDSARSMTYLCLRATLNVTENWVAFNATKIYFLLFLNSHRSGILWKVYSIVLTYFLK